MTRPCLAATLVAASLLSSPNPSRGQAPVFPSQVELVTVDVVVLDEKGAALRGLDPGDFVLREDGKPQAIASFEAVERTVVERDHGPDPSPVTTSEGPEDERTSAFVLLVDDLGLDATRLPRLVAALGGLLEGAFRAGDEVTLATASGSVWWAFRFPEGREDLPILLARVKGRRLPETALDLMSDYEAYQIANLERTPLGADDPLPTYLGRLVRRWAGSACFATRVEACAHLVKAHASERDADRKARTRALMATVERAVFSLTGVRGRKELFLFSGGFVMDPNQDEVRQVAGICREANVVVNFLDARGTLLRMTEASAEFTGNPPDPLDLGQATFEQRQDEIGGSLKLAEDTGGLAVTGVDDFAAGTRRILDESRFYYMLGFHPPPGKGPRDWRRIKVEVRRPGAKVRSRRGYTLRPTGATEGALLAATGKKKDSKRLDPADQAAGSLNLDRALLNTQVGRALPLRVLPYVGDERSPGKVRVRLAVEVDERALFKDAPKDGARAALRMVVQAAQRDTGDVSREAQRFTVSVQAARAPAWATLYQELALAPGLAQVRVVVLDEASGRLGAVTTRVHIPEGGKLRLATPVLADELKEPLQAGGTPRLIVPAHRVFSNASKILYGQVQVLGAVPSSSSGAPEVEVSYILRRANGPEVSASTPSLIAAAPGGAVVRLFGLPLAILPKGDYELAVRVRDRTNGSTAERVEPFSVEGDLSRPRAESLEPSPVPHSVDIPPAVANPRPRDAAGPVAGALKGILRRAGEYVVSYEAKASGVVLEEAYTQRIRSASAGATFRALLSDFVLVSLPGEVGVMGFRDVFRVDGREVRGRDQRLEKLFLAPNARGVVQAQAVLDESARYNLGATRRNFNLPTIALAILRPEFQPRFAFRDEGTKKRRGRVVREIEYEELVKPTLVRNPAKDRDYFARGRILIAEDTAAVLRTEMRFDHEGGRTEITVDYEWDASLELWLPAAMYETDENRLRGGQRGLGGTASGTSGSEALSAHAEYRKPRRFGVTTEEKLHPQ